jgi:hypothetical protein
MQTKYATTFLAITLIAVMMIGMQIEPIDAKKAQVTHTRMYGSATKNIVCGDKLCSEPDTPKQSPTTTEPTNSMSPTNTCSKNSIQMKSSCSSFNIKGATVRSSMFDETRGVTTIKIQSTDDGKLTLNTASSLLDTIAMILVDGEESNDVSADDSKITIEFYAGTETIEIFGN